MEQRIIKLQIANEYIVGSGVSVGAVGSHDDVLLEMDFRSSALWAGTTRRAIFADALGVPVTPIILATNLLEEGQSDVYLVPVPAEAKTAAGECFLTVEGYIGEGESEIVRVVTEEVTFRVLPSRLYTSESTLTPDAAEQLQAEIDEIKEDIADAAAAAVALEKTEAARDAALTYASRSAGYMSGAEEQAKEAKKHAQTALQAVSDAGEKVLDAGAEADRAEEAAARAEAEAERVTVPAAVGVYNIILEDRATGQRYALLIEKGLICTLEVRSDLEATEMLLVDNATGTAYVLGVDAGNLYIEEAT